MNCYKDPKHKGKELEKKEGKIAVVTVFYVGKEGRESYHILDESRNVTGDYKDDKLDNIRFSMRCYGKYDAGMDYDMILVDNSTDNEEALEYYKTLGKIHRRENNGFSFGGYKWVWENLPKYDYYLFIEQDFVPCKDGWLKEIFDRFRSDPKIGAVGNVVEYRDTNDPSKEAVAEQIKVVKTRRNHIINLDGAYTFTSREVLEQVDEHGGLLVVDGKVDTSTFNEILFTQPILELGYTIEGFGNRDFEKTDVIHFYGSRKGDLTRDFEPAKLAPIVDGITRITCEQMRKYFYV